MEKKRNKKIEIPIATIALSSFVLFFYLLSSGIVRPYLITCWAWADVSALMVSLFMVRATADKSVLKRHQILITTILISAAVLFAAFIPLVLSPASTTVVSLFDFNLICSAIFIFIFDMPVFLFIKIVDWRAERVQKPNQSLISKIWEN